MKTVNLGDKYSHRLTLRLTNEQYDFLIKVSSILDTSPSDILRMLVNSSMASKKNGLAIYENILKGMVGMDENVKTNSDNII